MAINIKNQRTVDAVRRLAEHYGLSYTRAIEVAAEQALQTPSESTLAVDLRKVQQIAADYRAHLPTGHWLCQDDSDGDDLYGDDGLYR